MKWTTRGTLGFISAGLVMFALDDEGGADGGHLVVRSLTLVDADGKTNVVLRADAGVFEINVSDQGGGPGARFRFGQLEGSGHIAALAIKGGGTGRETILGVRDSGGLSGLEVYSSGDEPLAVLGANEERSILGLSDVTGGAKVSFEAGGDSAAALLIGASSEAQVGVSAGHQLHPDGMQVTDGKSYSVRLGQWGSEGVFGFQATDSDISRISMIANGTGDGSLTFVGDDGEPKAGIGVVNGSDGMVYAVDEEGDVFGLVPK